MREIACFCVFLKHLTSLTSYVAITSDYPGRLKQNLRHPTYLQELGQKQGPQLIPKVSVAQLANNVNKDITIMLTEHLIKRTSVTCI